MKISVCITLFNEEKSVSNLIKSLLKQTKKPDEIIIVDAESSDKTVDIIRHFQKKDKRVKLLVQKCSRARGRNLTVEIAKGSIIAMTDGECLPKSDWLEKITDPLKEKKIDIVAGFYEMVGNNNLQKAIATFLGVVPRDFNINFLPSTRSIAFRKSVWEELGGFPEKLRGTAEDTVFNFKAIDAGKNIARVKSAIVEWRMPESIDEFSKKIKNYAKGDIQSGILFHSSKGITSHNIKAMLVFARYILGFIGLFTLFINLSLLFPIFVLFIIYVTWSFFKTFNKTNKIKIALWGILLQFVADISVMAGVIEGLKTKM